MTFDDLPLGETFRFPLISGDTKLYVKVDDDRYKQVDGSPRVSQRMWPINTPVVPVGVK